MVSILSSAELVLSLSKDGVERVSKDAALGQIASFDTAFATLRPTQDATSE
jgi:hypothetical protein